MSNVEWDNRKLNMAIANMRKCDGLDLSVGIHKSAGSHRGEDGMPAEVAFIGAVHEYGAPSVNIPERSFLRSTLADESKHSIGEFGDTVWDAISKGTDPRKGLSVLGQYVTSRVKKQIRDRIDPPLSAATLATKGPATPTRRKKGDKKRRSSVPLVDTGQLINSITYKVTHDG